MKKWYSFYANSNETEFLLQEVEAKIDLGSIKLQQVAAEIAENDYDEKLQQVVAEIHFPKIFGFVPWGHHVQIVTKCKSVEEALF